MEEAAHSSWKNRVQGSNSGAEEIRSGEEGGGAESFGGAQLWSSSSCWIAAANLIM